MKRYGEIYGDVCDIDNLIYAHKQARRNKTFYNEVKMVDMNTEHYLSKIQQDLIDKTYKTSEYNIFTKIDKGKERTIYKLPYYPDRIVHWAVMLQIEEILIKTMPTFTCASIKNRGIHYASNLLKKYLKDETNTKYCYKMDIKKYFENIDHNILKKMLRKKFKDSDLLWLLDEIIDSIPSEKGIPIGNYLSQYFANFYLSYFGHWLKEVKKVKYCIVYMDDIVILGESKEYLHKLRKDIEEYLSVNLKLKIKENWQVFPVDVRGVDFVGYRHFRKYTLLRKSTYKKMKHKMTMIKRKNNISYSEWCSINSYKGWLIHCNSFNLYNKYIRILTPLERKYYYKNIKYGGDIKCYT